MQPDLRNKHRFNLPRMLKEIAYILSVLFTASISSCALSHSRVYQTITASIAHRSTIATIGSIVSEYAFFFLIAKLFILFETYPEETALISWVYRLDVVVMLFLWSLFLQGVFSRHPIYEITKFMRNNTSTVPPSIFTWSFWFRFHNPFWSSRALLIQENSIIY